MQGKTVFLDMDGTIANTMSALYSVFSDFLAARGITTNQAEFEDHLGPSLRELVNDLKRKYGWEETVPTLLADYNARIASDYVNRAAPFAGTKVFLQNLIDRKLKIWLVTSAVSPIASGFLYRHDLEKYFSGVAAADRVAKAKPHPELFQLALQESHTQAVNGIAVDDSPAGIYSAQGAGLKAILIRHDGMPEHKDQNLKPDFAAGGYTELLNIIDGWLNA